MERGAGHQGSLGSGSELAKESGSEPRQVKQADMRYNKIPGATCELEINPYTVREACLRSGKLPGTTAKMPSHSLPTGSWYFDISRVSSCFSALSL